MVYDGVSWQLFPLPNKTIVRFIAFDNNGRLYAGGQDELGYFEPDKNGSLTFTSLVNRIDPADRQFADIWNIAIPDDDDVFFRSTSRIFYFHKGKITVYRPQTSWEFSGLFGKQVIAQDESEGILLFDNGKWKPLISQQALPKNFKITGIISFQGGSLITTLQSGLYTLVQSTLTPFFLKGMGVNNTQYFTCAQQLQGKQILLGTYDNGIIHADIGGNIIGTFSKNNSLLNNDVKCIFTDSRNNIWAGLDNGISYLRWSDAVKKINPNVFNGAAGYSSAILNSKIYFALANGIYSMPVNHGEDISLRYAAPEKIAGGLSWRVNAVKGHLFAGRDDGLYEVMGNKLVEIDGRTGYWMVEPLSASSEPLRLAAGNYLGVSFFNESGKAFLPGGELAGINASSRFVAYDSALKIIWVSHPYRGVYKISLTNQSAKLFTAKEGLPSDLDNHIFSVAGKVVAATVKGIYVYNINNDRFEPSAYYRKIFGDMSLRYLQDDKNGNIWFVHEKKLGVVDYAKKSIIYFPELSGKILSGFEHVLPVDSLNILVGSVDGFLHINYEQYKKNAYTPQVYISRVTAKNRKDSLLYGGFEPSVTPSEKSEIKLGYRWSSFHFEFASSSYEMTGFMEYSWQLKGFDKDWSDWSKTTYKDYTNIPHGDYIFQVKARNNLGAESVIATLPFTVTPAWYESILARIIYVLAALFLLYSLWQWRERKLHKQQEEKMREERKRFEEEQKQMETEHQLAIEQSEKEMIRLKNEKLEAEIEFKNAELASTAMNLVQKKEFLVKLKEELNRMKQPQAPGPGAIETAELNKLVRSLAEQLNAGDEWEQFSLLFNKLHRDYLVTLKEKYPGLTAHDLKLCAYLRMNLSSKEIAHLMSISVRGVEISRYRLRKKLEIPPKEDLFQFLLKIDSGMKT